VELEVIPAPVAAVVVAATHEQVTVNKPRVTVPAKAQDVPFRLALDLVYHLSSFAAA